MAARPPLAMAAGARASGWEEGLPDLPLPGPELGDAWSLLGKLLALLDPGRKRLDHFRCELAYMQLFPSDRSHADELLTAMKGWVGKSCI